jgi:hypothetical protein
MPFALYLALVAGTPPQVQSDMRPPVSVEADRFDRGVNAVVQSVRLRIEQSSYMSGRTRTGSASALDDLLPGPPPSPGDEPRLKTDSTGVMTYCDGIQGELEKRGMKFFRKVISQNTRYGVVWRADIAAMGSETPDSRVICWKRPGRGDYSLLIHPLAMFDPSQSVEPLTP